MPGGVSSHQSGTERKTNVKTTEEKPKRPNRSKREPSEFKKKKKRAQILNQDTCYTENSLLLSVMRRDGLIILVSMTRTRNRRLLAEFTEKE